MGKIVQKKKTRHGWRLAAVWAVLLVAYSNSFDSGLVFDNSSIIGGDPRIREATSANVGAIVKGGYRYSNPNDGLYRPLATLTYLANYAILGNGLQPDGYHWVNLALHAVNVALVYALGLLVLGETAPAWALAALWGLHPLLTESVTNIVGRADLLAAFGVLAGLLCYAKASAEVGRRRAWWLAGVAAAQAIGLFSKESAVVLPAVMLLYDFAGFDRAGWRRRAAAYGALAVPVAAFFALRARVHPHLVTGFAENPLLAADFVTARLTAVKVLGKLMGLFAWPARLSADYSYNAVPLAGWGDLGALAALAVSAGAAVLAVRLAIRPSAEGRPALFFVAFFFVTVLPTSNLVLLIGSIMAERFLYLPAVGLAGLVLVAARRIPLPDRVRGRAAWAALAIASVALAARTYARNADWKDEASLWTTAVEVSPESGKAHYNLGHALERLPGRMPDAVNQYRTAIRIDPNDAEAHTNLGNALAAMPGRMPEAIAEYQAALRVNPGRAEPHNDLGNALATMPGRLPDALAEYQAALGIQPRNAELHYNLANVLARMPGRAADAIAEYRAAIAIDPNHADAHASLAHLLAGLPGRLAEAIAEYRAAIAIDPNLVSARINLANTLAATPGRLPEAVAEYQAAVRTAPDSPEAHFDLGTALERLPGRLADAIAEYQAAVRIAPDFVEAHVNLANALAQTPRQAEAMAEYEAALRLRPDPLVRQALERLRPRR